MAIRRIRIDYTVYTPNYHPGEGECWDLQTLTKAKKKAQGFGVGATIFRNYNQRNKKGMILGDWWQDDRFWLWDGVSFRRKPDTEPR